MIYAFIVGATGAVYACLYGFIHPSFFNTALSTEVAILGIIGGMGIIYGPLLAAVLLVSGREIMRANLGSSLESLYLAVYAVVLIVIALFRPKGLAPMLRNGWEKLTRLLFGDDNGIRTHAPRL